MRGEPDYPQSPVAASGFFSLASLTPECRRLPMANACAFSGGARTSRQCRLQYSGRQSFQVGFHDFTERLRIELGFDFATSNALEISGGKLTGQVLGELSTRAPRRAASKPCASNWADLAQVIAVGDGANDLLMMAEAGLRLPTTPNPQHAQVQTSP